MVGLIILAIIVWMAYEMWSAPLVDKDENIIKPGKKLKNLFKK